MQDFEIYVKQKQDHAEIQFAFLILSTLALSIQFQATSDKSFKWFLVASWCLTSVAGLVAGYRISHSISHDRFSQYMISNGKLVTTYKKASAGLVHFEDNKGFLLGPKLVQEKLTAFEEHQKKLEELRDKSADNVNRFSKIQIYCYLFGILLNLTRALREFETTILNILMVKDSAINIAQITAAATIT